MCLFEDPRHGRFSGVLRRHTRMRSGPRLGVRLVDVTVDGTPVIEASVVTPCTFEHAALGRVPIRDPQPAQWRRELAEFDADEGPGGPRFTDGLVRR